MKTTIDIWIGKLFTIYERNKILLFQSFGFTFVLGLIAHGFIYLNAVFSHDSMNLTTNGGYVFIVMLGRFFALVHNIFSGISSIPLIIGIFSLLWISLTISVLAKFFDVKSKLFLFLLSAIFLINLSFILLNATYIFMSANNMFALLSATTAVYICKRFHLGFLYGSICIMVSLATYQSYIAIAVGLVIIMAIVMVLQQKDTQKIVIYAFKNTLMFIIGGLLYAIVWKVVRKILNIDIYQGYQNLDKITDFTNISMLNLIIKTYKKFFDYWLNITAYNTLLVFWINIIISIVILILLLIFCKKISLKKILLLFLLLLIIPFGLNIITFISKGINHDVMTFSFCLVYILFFMIFYTIKHGSLSNISQFVLILLISILFLNGAIFSNNIYLKKKLEYDATMAHMIRIIDRIEILDGYKPGVTPVIFIGVPEDNRYLNHPRYKFEKYNKFTGTGSSVSITYFGTLSLYLRDILNITINTDINTESYKSKKEVSGMPAFPHKDAVKLIDGAVIIKLNDGNER